jgi:hypothetical protein
VEAGVNANEAVICIDLLNGDGCEIADAAELKQVISMWVSLKNEQKRRQSAEWLAGSHAERLLRAREWYRNDLFEDQREIMSLSLGPGMNLLRTPYGDFDIMELR